MYYGTSSAISGANSVCSRHERAILIVAVLLLTVQIVMADQPDGHYMQMVWTNLPAQQLDLDGDREYFGMDVSLFSTHPAEGQIEFDNIYRIKVNQDILNSDNSAMQGHPYKKMQQVWKIPYLLRVKTNRSFRLIQ